MPWDFLQEAPVLVLAILGLTKRPFGDYFLFSLGFLSKSKQWSSGVERFLEAVLEAVRFFGGEDWQEVFGMEVFLNKLWLFFLVGRGKLEQKMNKTRCLV